VFGFIYTSAVVLRNCIGIMGAREAAGRSAWEGVELIRLDWGALFALPIVVFGFNCHANAVAIFQEVQLHDKRTDPEIRHVCVMHWCMHFRCHANHLNRVAHLSRMHPALCMNLLDCPSAGRGA